MISLGKGNHKLSKDILIWNLPSGKTCPGSGECSKYCYAKKAERQYPGVRASRDHNLKLCQEKDFIDAMVTHLSARKESICRIHESGDFYSKEYFNKWKEIAWYFWMRNKFKYLLSLYKISDKEWIGITQKMLDDIKENIKESDPKIWSTEKDVQDLLENIARETQKRLKNKGEKVIEDIEKKGSQNPKNGTLEIKKIFVRKERNNGNLSPRKRNWKSAGNANQSRMSGERKNTRIQNIGLKNYRNAKISEIETRSKFFPTTLMANLSVPVVMKRPLSFLPSTTSIIMETNTDEKCERISIHGSKQMVIRKAFKSFVGTVMKRNAFLELVLTKEKVAKTFFCYTKSFVLFNLYENLPDNFLVIQSYGSKDDTKVDTTHSTARVIEDETDLYPGEVLCGYYKKGHGKCGEECRLCMELGVHHVAFKKH